MVADAKAGKLNYLVLSLSSPGTQVPDIRRDEPDRADEAFCPHDLAAKGNKWDPKYILWTACRSDQTSAGSNIAGG